MPDKNIILNHNYINVIQKTNVFLIVPSSLSLTLCIMDITLLTRSIIHMIPIHNTNKIILNLLIEYQPHNYEYITYYTLKSF